MIQGARNSHKGRTDPGRSGHRGHRPYRALRVERKLKALENDPVGLLEYIRAMARRTSEGLEALVEYNRLDLSMETLIMDESKL